MKPSLVGVTQLGYWLKVGCTLDLPGGVSCGNHMASPIGGPPDS